MPELREDPPDALHDVDVHGLVVGLEVDPPAGARDDGLPLGDVLGDDAAAGLVVLADAEVELVDLSMGACRCPSMGASAMTS